MALVSFMIGGKSGRKERGDEELDTNTQWKHMDRSHRLGGSRSIFLHVIKTRDISGHYEIREWAKGQGLRVAKVGGN